MERACIRCGTTSTSLWRPEVLSGPKSPDALQRSHQHGSAKNSASHENGLNGFHSVKRPRSHAEEGSSRQQANKRQHTASIEGDIKLSPTQKPYFAVQRHFDARGHVIEWTVTDCSIDDSRDFQQLKHAQAFVDECWAFISVELRASKAHGGAGAAGAAQQLVQQPPGTQAAQDRRQSSSSGGRHVMLQATAAAADHVKLSPSASPSSGIPAPSPCVSPRSQPAHEEPDMQRSPSFRKIQSKTSDVCLPGKADAQHGTASDQAELPVRSSSVSPRWPCKSRQMANVTALHGGLNQQATKHHQAARSRPELAGFAARSSPISQGQSTSKQASAVDMPDTHHSRPVHLQTNSSQLNGLMQLETSESRPTRRAMDALPRCDVSMPPLPGVSKSPTLAATSAHCPVKVEQADPLLLSTSIHPILPLQPWGKPTLSPHSPTDPSGSTHADQGGSGMHPDQQPHSVARVRSPSVTISQADIPSARPGSAGTKGAPRTGRNHHRAGASPSNLNKSVGYIGSTYLGVNGVRHSPEFPLRWRAGTWDPLVKKTVYIGSYDTEVSNSVRRSYVSAHNGHGGSKSQRQSAAGALVAKAAGRPKASRDGTHQGRHALWRPQPVPNQSGCTGVSYADGKWRAQIKVDNVVQYLGRFQYKEDAANAYEQAAMQRLVRQDASH
ncbi:hypothetical protein WJX79_008199 [Trebouxia sp. C0005]